MIVFPANTKIITDIHHRIEETPHGLMLPAVSDEFKADQWQDYDALRSCLIVIGEERADSVGAIWSAASIVAYALTEPEIQDRDNVIILSGNGVDEFTANAIEYGSLLVADIRDQEHKPEFPALYPHEEFHFIDRKSPPVRRVLVWNRFPREDQLRRRAANELFLRIEGGIRGLANDIVCSGCTSDLTFTDFLTRNMPADKAYAIVKAAAFDQLDETEANLLTAVFKQENQFDMNIGAIMRNANIDAPEATIRAYIDETPEGQLKIKIGNIFSCWDQALPISNDIENIAGDTNDKEESSIEHITSEIHRIGEEYGVDIMISTMTDTDIPSEYILDKQQILGDNGRRYAIHEKAMLQRKNK